MIRPLLFSQILLIILSTSLLNAQDDYYASQWKKVEDLRSELKSRSAFEHVEEIYSRARQDSRYDQLIRSLIYLSGLALDFEDKDPAERIVELENSLDSIASPSARAVIHSILGEMYHNYGMVNLGRFYDRSNSGEESLAFASLEEIQQKSMVHFNASVISDHDLSLQNLDGLFTRSEDQLWTMEAENLQSFLIFRAIEHYMNNAAFATIEAGRFLINDPSYFSPGPAFLEIDLSQSTGDYRQTCLSLFQKAESSGFVSSENKHKLYFKRLDYVRSHYDKEDADALYLDALRSNTVSAWPEGIAYLKIIDYYLEKGEQNNQPGNSQSEMAFKEAFRYIQKFNKTHPRSVFRKAVNAQRQRLNRRLMTVEMESVVPSSRDFLVQLSYRNVQQIHLKLFSLDSRTDSLYHHARNNEEKISVLEKARSLRDWKLALPASGDFNFHSTEIPVKALDYGNYILVISDRDKMSFSDKSLINLAYFTVSDLAEYSYYDSKGNKGRVVNRSTGLPLENVQIEVRESFYNPLMRSREYKLIDKLKTGRDGLYDCSGLSTRQYTLRFIHGEDTLALREENYRYRYDRDDDMKERALVFTDRAIYRPGQTVHFKTLVYSMDAQGNSSLSKEGRKLTVSLKDVNNQLVSQMDLITNSYGSCHGRFVLPKGKLNGQFHIELSAAAARHYFRVEEYKRPGILASFDSLDQNYVQGDSIFINGRLQSYSGLALENAEVRYTVTRQPVRWFYRNVYTPMRSETVALGTCNTNGEGVFGFAFKSIRSANNPSYEYTVRCEIKDRTGESTELNKIFVLSDSPFQFHVDVPSEIIQGEALKAQLRARNLEGKAVQVTVEAEILQLAHPPKYFKDKYWSAPDQHIINQQEYRQRFPDEAYMSREAKDWDVIDTIGSYRSSGDEITFKKSGSKMAPGVYRILFTATDTKGNKDSLVRTVHVASGKSLSLPTKPIWMTGMQDSYQPGDVLEIQLSAPFKKYELFYFISKGSQVIMNGRLDKNNRKIKLPISEDYRGGLNLSCIMVKHNRVYEESWSIDVPWNNKMLTVEFEKINISVRPGSEQSILISLKDAEGKPVEAEITAAMYDSRLDAFTTHSWEHSIYPVNPYGIRFLHRTFRSAWVYGQGYERSVPYQSISFAFAPTFNYFGFENLVMNYRMTAVAYRTDDMVMKSGMAPESADEGGLSYAEQENRDGSVSNPEMDQDPEAQSDKAIRDVLDELVFFYPVLRTDSNGQVVIDYKMNDALSSYRLMIFAHDAKLAYGLKETHVQTSKPLMIESFLPRFLRQGDSIRLTARLSNASPDAITGNAEIRLYDLFSSAELSDSFIAEEWRSQSVTVQPGKSVTLDWKVKVPGDYSGMLRLGMYIDAGILSDAEEHLIPVVSNKIHITEAWPIYSRKETESTYIFEGLNQAASSSERTAEKLILNYVPDPSWMILKALPAMMPENPYQSMAVMERIYASCLGYRLLETHPGLRAAVQRWQDLPPRSALRSSEDLLKSGLDNSPWLNDAIREELNMKQIGFLLDENTYRYTLRADIGTLQDYQQADGGFAWSSGGRSNWYVTQYILELLSRLQKLKALSSDDRLAALIQRATRYIDEQFIEYHEKSADYNKGIPPMIAQYLFVRHAVGLPMEKPVREAVSVVLDKAKGQWIHNNTFTQSLLARSFLMSGDTITASLIKASMDERMIKNENTGYYWNDQAGYYWYELSLDRQAGMIEFYSMMDSDKSVLDGMRMWLLKNKQLNSWETSHGTASAVYSFYSQDGSPDSGGTISFEFPNSGELFSYDLSSLIDEEIRIEWNDKELIRSSTRMVIDNNSGRTGWGGMYYQYSDAFENIRSFSETPLQIEKSIGRIMASLSGDRFVPVQKGDSLNVGDRLRTRIAISVDRPMEYVLLEDKRASGLEPVNVISAYRWQDGLGYYEVTEDLGSRFFIEFLPKGNFVFEYDVFVTHAGLFSGGISNIRSMYAPEFTSHSEGTLMMAEK